MTILILIENVRISAPKRFSCRHLPNGCTLESFRDDRDLLNFKYICQKLTQKFEFDIQQIMSENMCQVLVHPLTIFFRLRKYSIIDAQTFRLDQLCHFSQKVFNSDSSFILEFRRINGFGLDYPEQSRFEYNNSLILRFHSVRLNFYSNQIHAIKSCGQLDDYAQPRTLFHLITKPSWLSIRVSFLSLIKSKPICPLIFRNVSITILYFYNLVNTFYKSNVPKFLPMPRKHELDNQMKNTVQGIKELKIHDFYMSHLDATLLSPHVFSEIWYLGLFGEIRSIERGLFTRFKRIRILGVLLKNFRRLCLNGGIAWMSDLNPDLNFDLPNLDWTHLMEQLGENKSVNIRITSWSDVKSSQYEFSGQFEIEPSNVFPDEDFCVYRDFPFHQLVQVTFDYYTNVIKYESCTVAWLIRYYEIIDRAYNVYDPEQTNYTYIRSVVAKCDFEER